MVTMGLITVSAYAQENKKVSDQIIAMEKAALERWNHGDIQGYLDIYAEDIVYFDPMLDKRMDGLKKLEEYYRPLNGKINVTESEMIDPKVQSVDNMAVLTFNLRSVEANHLYRWNCTEVYRKDEKNQWKIVQTHWSFVKSCPEQN
jgi:ketosteroid isomerase-like protein